MVAGLPPPESSGAGAELVSSLELLRRAQSGDKGALDLLIEAYLPNLVRWAHGKLPKEARGNLDTADLVQEAIVGLLKNIQTLKRDRLHLLDAYLRQAIRNRIRDEIRRVRRRPPDKPVQETTRDRGPTPLDMAIGKQALQRYEHALARLTRKDREAIVLRIERGLSYEDLAVALGKPSIEAAQMAVSRSLRRLAEEMRV